MTSEHWLQSGTKASRRGTIQAKEMPAQSSWARSTPGLSVRGKREGRISEGCGCASGEGQGQWEARSKVSPSTLNKGRTHWRILIRGIRFYLYIDKVTLAAVFRLKVR